MGVVAGRQPFACLNYDGTLSEIVSDPDTATLVDGAAKALAQLAAQCPVAILSGRDLADIRDRLGLPGIWYGGGHGFEVIGPDGTYHQNDAAAAAIPALETAAAGLRNDVRPIPGALVEHKRFAVAVHYRNVAPDRVAEVVAAAHRHARRHSLRVTNGRKVVELWPNVEWDKGTALQGISDSIHQSGRVVPIYIGDDLSDEDAFDAIQYSGIGIVVRHDEDAGRPTAAQYTLRNPQEVSKFLHVAANSLADHQQIFNDTWTFTFEGYDPPSEKLREALCTVGNGYFATRGAAPESKADQVHYPGTYAAGVYNRLDDLVGGMRTQHESLVNLPNWLPLTFRIDGGDWFDVDKVTLSSYRQTFDLRGAVLTRELRFRDNAGRTTSVTQHRYKDLAGVERFFRTLNSELDVRPIRHRLADRVRAHMFLRMLSYYISWHMKQALAPILFHDNDKPAAAAKRADPVAPLHRIDHTASNCEISHRLSILSRVTRTLDAVLGRWVMRPR